MFWSYDHHQAENILIARVTQLTTDTSFYNIANINDRLLYLAVLVDMVVVMGDVFASVYNFHSPLSSKLKLSIQCDCNLCF
jgi:hypothetical protein